MKTKILAFVLLISTLTFSQTVSTLSGTLNPTIYMRNNGYNNGEGKVATSKYPTAIAVDSNELIHFWDMYIPIERTVTQTGWTDEGAGSAVWTDFDSQNPSKPFGFLGYGYSDGFGSMVKFGYPQGATSDKNGNVYAADTYNNRIRKRLPSGEWITIAGSGAPGNLDGEGITSQFKNPQGLCVDAAGNIWVADSGNKRIRKITSTGTVSTVSSSLVGFRCPRAIAVDSANNLWVVDNVAGNVKKIATDGSISVVATIACPNGIVIDSKGNKIITDGTTSNIYKIDIAGVLSLWFGNGSGYRDGGKTVAQFQNPTGICIDSNDIVYIADYNNQRIRKITP